MKKYLILSLFLSLLINVSPEMAYSVGNDLCTMDNYNIGNKFTRTLSNVSGTNFLITQIAKSQIKKNLKKQTDGVFDVDLKSFGTKSLIDGKFKDLRLSSKNANFGGVYISDIKINTVCNYNYIKQTKNDLLFPENFIMNFSGKITQNDLQKTLVSNDYKKELQKLNMKLNKTGGIKVYEPRFTILKDKLKMNLSCYLPFIGEKSITAYYSLKVTEGKITLADLQVDNYGKVNANLILPLINMLNPLSFDTYVSPSSKALISTKNIKIVNNEIFLDGNIFIAQNYKK